MTGPQLAAPPSAGVCTENNVPADAQGMQNHAVEPPAVFDNASAEIADIDQRLHALQTFLRAAKAGGPGKDT